MISKILSTVMNGLKVVRTEVEVGFSRGIPGITIVGLPDNAVKESKERIRFAIKNAGYRFPVSTKIVVNLSPADVRKEGAALDLPIAAGILKNQYQVESDWFSRYLFYGELNLNGELNAVNGVLNLAIYARQKGFAGVVIPFKNAREAASVKGIRVVALRHLSELAGLFDGEGLDTLSCTAEGRNSSAPEPVVDFREVRGQYLLKRIMEIAAAGFHNVLMMGPPGSGKSMVSKALPGILPDMQEQEILETSLIYSAAGLLNNETGLITRRPFRSPHHTISDVGLCGGGRFPAPGEISLAHNGVLFLDELPHFKKSSIEVLRQPMEDHHITISRSLNSYTFPARFMLVGAMNPCEDSLGGRGNRYYECTEVQKRRYYSKISRPLQDRIDLQVRVHKVAIDDIMNRSRGESSSAIKARVVAARKVQLQRFDSRRRRRIFANAQMENRDVREFCRLKPEERALLRGFMEKLGLSARGYFKLLKISRTIADLAGEREIRRVHLQESLQYRNLDFS